MQTKGHYILLLFVTRFRFQRTGACIFQSSSAESIFMPKRIKLGSEKKINLHLQIAMVMNPRVHVYFHGPRGDTVETVQL